jgi:hypothetical protein
VSFDKITAISSNIEEENKQEASVPKRFSIKANVN